MFSLMSTPGSERLQLVTQRTHLSAPRGANILIVSAEIWRERML